MAKLTDRELDDWANYWRKRIDALLAQTQAPNRVAITSGDRRPPREMFGICEEKSGKTGNTIVKQKPANRRSRKPGNPAGQHQTRPIIGNSGFTRQEAPVVVTAAGDPEGREV